MEKLILEDLPYVDGSPLEGQKRIDWIKDGEDISGATTKYGNDGVMNRPAVSVFKDVEVLDRNINLVSKSLDDANGNIKVIQDILAVSGDTEALAQIGKNAEDITALKAEVLVHDGNIKTASDKIEAIEADIGPFNPELDSIYRTIRGDLHWIKTELGRYPGQDINGISDPGAESSGIKRRIINNNTVISDHSTRIAKLESEFEDSDVGSLTVEVQNLRSELGPRPSSFTDNVYTKISRLETSNNGLSRNMENVLDSIGYNQGVQSLYSLVDTNKTNIEDIRTELDSTGGIKPRITSIETQIGTSLVPSSINGRLKTNADNIDSVRQIVGADTSSGLRGEVSWINQTVGITKDSTPAPAGSLIYKVNILTNSQAQLANDVQNLQIEIGNNSEGLKGQVINLNSLINGTNPNGTTVEQKGILPTVKKHETDITTNTANIAQLRTDVDALGGGTAIIDEINGIKADVVVLKANDTEHDSSINTLETKVSSLETDVGALKTATADLPALNTKVDGIEARVLALESDVNTLKVKVSTLETAGYITEAPSDGQAYVRKDGAWVLLSTFLAP